jgi:hypothetical protein
MALPPAPRLQAGGAARGGGNVGKRNGRLARGPAPRHVIRGSQPKVSPPPLRPVDPRAPLRGETLGTAAKAGCPFGFQRDFPGRPLGTPAGSGGGGR